MSSSVLFIGFNQKIAPITKPSLARFIAAEWGLTSYPQKTLENNDFDLTNPPDIIIYYHSGNHDYLLWKKLKDVWGHSPFLLCITGEAQNFSTWVADWSLSFEPDNARNHYFNITWQLNRPELPALLSLTLSKTKSNPKFTSIYTLDEIKVATEMVQKLRSTPKNRFCNFVYSHSSLDPRFAGISKRQELCRTLASYKKVDCAGTVRNNTDELKKIENKFERRIAKLKYLANYKFTIAGENQSYPFYITEKILYPLVAGSIPIYWGCSEVTKLVNPQAFINCNDYASWDDVLARVKEIDNDPELYASYINAPPFLEDSIVYDLNVDKIKQKLDIIKQHFLTHHQKTIKLTAYRSPHWWQRKFISLRHKPWHTLYLELKVLHLRFVTKGMRKVVAYYCERWLRIFS